MKTQKLPLRYKLSITIIVLIVALVAIFVLTTITKQSQSTNSVTQTSQKAEKQSDYISYPGKKNTTALALLKEKYDKVVTKSSSYGEYVESIGELTGGQDNKYWTFYVDGKMASVGADSYIAKGGEKIEWKFEKAQ